MQCIKVDVGKQVLITYDGKKERVFPNPSSTVPVCSDVGNALLMALKG